jgi:hypothetical protein
VRAAHTTRSRTPRTMLRHGSQALGSSPLPVAGWSPVPDNVSTATATTHVPSTTTLSMNASTPVEC